MTPEDDRFHRPTRETAAQSGDTDPHVRRSELDDRFDAMHVRIDSLQQLTSKIADGVQYARSESQRAVDMATQAKRDSDSAIESGRVLERAIQRAQDQLANGINTKIDSTNVKLDQAAAHLTRQDAKQETLSTNMAIVERRVGTVEHETQKQTPILTTLLEEARERAKVRAEADLRRERRDKRVLFWFAVGTPSCAAAYELAKHFLGV